MATNPRRRRKFSQSVGWTMVVAGLCCVFDIASAPAQTGAGGCDLLTAEGPICSNYLACDSYGIEPSCSQDGFFAQLNQRRATLAKNGISLQNNLTQYYFGNTTGGLEREFRYSGHGDYLANFDFGKLGVQEGLFLTVRTEHRFGESGSGLSGSFIPSTLPADLPSAEKEHLYVTNFLITQALSEDFVLFAGKVDALSGDANDFAQARGITQFSNLAFVGNPATLRTIPYSTLGAGCSFLLEGEPLLSFMVLNAVDTTRTIGLGELFNEGCALTTELRLPTNFFDLPGHQLFGATWSSREVASLSQDPRVILPTIPIDRQSGSWSLYWNCDQYLVSDRRDPKRGWGYFGRAAIADDQTNPIAYFLSAGLGGTSMISGREHDRFGMGYYYSSTSNPIAPFIANAIGGLKDEQGVELFYNAAVNSMVSVTPDLQVISSFRDSLDTALLAGVRMNVAF
ncbi:carbohydrate porin [Aureliella helgolandensis]|uniref:Carbohydrate-selective porin, OprB family n=1 Tax=Aureliella helgolandensis TaxID=2527968 RepID=A0A518G952_9BACT|nr:carbohydrate porin [Aureliella helgolandensis]QDV25124.1 Carbohydrate-selective porin, OprB family [Aureliella helgolandensis]